MRHLLMHYRVLLCFAPEFDQALVSGRFVTSSEVVDDRFIQLQTKISRMKLSPLTETLKVRKLVLRDAW